MLERQKLSWVPWRVVEMLAYHWETNIGRYVLNATCTCNDHTRGGRCKHVAALSYELVQWCECRPLSLLGALGIDMQLLSMRRLEEGPSLFRFQSACMTLTSPPL